MLRPLVRALMRAALGGKRSRLILQNSDDVELFVRSRILDRAQIRLIRGSGVDCEQFSPLQESSRVWAMRESCFGCYCSARLLWDKGSRGIRNCRKAILRAAMIKPFDSCWQEVRMRAIPPRSASQGFAIGRKRGYSNGWATLTTCRPCSDLSISLYFPVTGKGCRRVSSRPQLVHCQS